MMTTYLLLLMLPDDIKSPRSLKITHLYTIKLHTSFIFVLLHLAIILLCMEQSSIGPPLHMPCLLLFLLSLSLVLGLIKNPSMSKLILLPLICLQYLHIFYFPQVFELRKIESLKLHPILLLLTESISEVFYIFMATIEPIIYPFNIKNDQ